jgi:hypothetical protein
MPLVKCPDCGTDVSDRAPTCLKCGAPRPADAPPFAVSSNGRNTHPLTWAVLAVILGVMLYFWAESNRSNRLPPLPVNVQFRKSLLGARAGYVLIVRNTSDSPLPIAATLTHPSINDSRTFSLYIPARSFTDVGKLNSGWTTQSGDQITLANNSFKPWSGSIP